MLPFCMTIPSRKVLYTSGHWNSNMARPSHFHLLTFSLSIMRAAGYLIPSLLTTQALAIPAWISPNHDVSNTLLDPEHNKLGGVASESSICSDIGTAALKAGGNAADSMVATVACVGVVGMCGNYRDSRCSGGLLTLSPIAVQVSLWDWRWRCR